MNKDTLLLALGGNAILQPKQEPTYANQAANVLTSAAFLVKLAVAGYRLAVTHGNGPQVGNLLRQNEEAAHVVPPFPLEVLTAQSQGYMGFMLQQALWSVLREYKRTEDVACLVGRVLVHEDDPAFSNPTKPVGLFYSEEDAEVLIREKGWQMKPDAGRGWRRVVPSPMPHLILDAPSIKAMLDAGFITIACGGGGIPVVRDKDSWRGVEAVVDKDLTGACLAREIGASVFIIVTDVSNACLHYGSPQQESLGHVSASKLEGYAAAGHFSKGSMGPKVQAALQFVRETGNTAIICALHEVEKAVAGEAGTHITAS